MAADSIVLGMALYGRSFIENSGLRKSFKAVGNDSCENGIWDYKALPLAADNVIHLPEILANYSYDAARRMLVIYYDTQVAYEKAHNIMSKGLSGGMRWKSTVIRGRNDNDYDLR